ncbi:MAG: Kelch repeat-containing protein, partial [Limisphaerales bacterium]
PIPGPHYWHSATLLPSGQVLIAGGYDDTGSTTNAELYNPATKSWTMTGGMNDGRAVFTTILLTNGQVLAAGGFFYEPSNQFGSLASAELYDPATGAWTRTGSMANARSGHTATLLPNGQVLVAGGNGDDGTLTNCELYDPSTGTWSATGGMNAPRAFHIAALLPNGLALAAGGDTNNPSTSELYDPATRTWTITTNPMITNCFLSTATLLPNGQVLVAGGFGPDGPAISSAELFDPATQTWTATATPLHTARAEHTATLLPDGMVLVAGGYSNFEYVGAVSSAETYNPAADIWTLTNQMSSPRGDFTATTLINGDVLVAGGYADVGTFLAATELYGPNSTTLNLNGTLLEPSGAFQLGFAAFPHSVNTLLSSTSLAQPPLNWVDLGAPSELSPGLFFFTDTGATNYPARYYRVRSP